MTLILGIDEAGRGPVIGPMVIGGALVKSDFESKLTELGVKDSKKIPQNKREIMFDQIIKISNSTDIKVVMPEEIDMAVESKNGMNLNWLEAVKSAEMINELKPDVVILDCPHPIPSKYETYVRELLDNKDVKRIGEHKADDNYVICGAASILAKVIREREMAEINAKYGEVGPGYPANPVTKKFVEENFEKHPEIFRKSWATYKNQVKKKKQSELSEF